MDRKESNFCNAYNYFIYHQQPKSCRKSDNDGKYAKFRNGNNPFKLLSTY